MKVTVFGLGYVGCVTMGCLAKLGHHVIGVDVNPAKVGLINEGKSTIVEELIGEIISSQRSAGRIRATEDYREAVAESAVSLVCVPTPPTDHGHLDLGPVLGVAGQFGEALADKRDFHTIALRSTVPPGTTARFARIVEDASGRAHGEAFAVVFNPEFLREGSSVRDFFDPPMVVVGGEGPRGIADLRKLYCGIDAPVYETSLGVAEIIKYVNNSYHALKVTFANEVGRICRAAGIDSQEVMRVFCADTRLNVSAAYLRPGFAYGGSCLPKDLKALRTLAHDSYVKTPVMDAIAASNDEQKRAAFRLIEKTGRRKVAVLGLSFKPGTDDLRSSPAVELVEFLLGKGYEVRIHDEHVVYSNLTGRNREYIDRTVPHLGRILAADLASAVRDAEVVVIAQADRRHYEATACLEGKVVIDLCGGADFPCQKLC